MRTGYVQTFSELFHNEKQNSNLVNLAEKSAELRLVDLEFKSEALTKVEYAPKWRSKSLDKFDSEKRGHVTKKLVILN